MHHCGRACSCIYDTCVSGVGVLMTETQAHLGSLQDASSMWLRSMWLKRPGI